MAVQMLPEDVADAFVKQYYAILRKCPHNLHKFYQDSSLLGWPQSDGVVVPVTTLSEINDKVMSSDFKDWSVEIKTAVSQESIDGSVLVVVTGCLNGDGVKKNFSQTFFLAKQEKGFFVLNDVLRLFDASETIEEAITNDDSIDDQVAPAPGKNSVSHNRPNSPASLQAEAEPKHENVNQTYEPYVAKDTDAEVSALTSPVTSQEKMHSVVTPAWKTKEISKKVSYASMVVKESRQSSAKTAMISTNADNQAFAPPIAKALTPAVDSVPKISTASTVAMANTSTPTGDGVHKVSNATTAASISTDPPRNAAPKLPKGNNGAQSSRAYPETRGIYIGNLPYDITKQGVLEVVKKFGQVRRSSDSIQIRRHEDGFCCGFVEFESADSARRAVEAHHVKFGEWESYITFKRSPYQGNDGGRTRSPSRIGNFRGRENGEFNKEQRHQNENRSGYGKGQVTGPRQSKPLDEWTRDEGEDDQGWSS